MKKAIREGRVGVVIQRSYGCGWSSCHHKSKQETLLFDERIVNSVETANWAELDRLCKEEIFGRHVPVGNLVVQWIPIGKRFIVLADNGLEDILFADNDDSVTA